jgi:hypothetical protein
MGTDTINDGCGAWFAARSVTPTAIGESQTKFSKTLLSYGVNCRQQRLSSLGIEWRLT